MPKVNAKISIDISSEDQLRLDDFKKQISDDADAMDDQRELANEDMRFVNVDGGMWEGFYENVFDFDDRVKLELDIVSNPLQRFIGEWNQNRTGVDFKPDDAGTTKDDSDLLNGIYRSNFRDNSGAVSTDNAVMECATVGFGSYKLGTEFDDEGDPENENQHIEWRPIYNSYNTVFWDQSALRMDKRDARHCTVLKQYTTSGFEAEFEGHDATSAYVPDDLSFTVGTLSGGVTNMEIVYVATRYEIVKKKTLLFIFNNLQTGKIEAYKKADHEKIKDELAADETRVFVRERHVVHTTCEKTVFSGTEILKSTRRIAGKYIPVVSMYAYRAFVDGTERYRGITRKLKDAQRLFNVQVSQLAENSASNGQEVPIFTREQVQNPDIADQWADKNNKPYLVVDSVKDADGNVLQAGPIGYNKPAALDQSTTALLSIVPQYIKDVTGFFPGEAINKETSGTALKALMKRENMNTQVISDNIKSAIEWSGEIYQAMAQEIYTTPRMVRLLQRDGIDSTANLLAPVMDEETGQNIESNDLRNKKFKSYADAGPQYETVREETVETMKSLLEILPNIPGGEEYTPVALAVLMDNVVGTGLDPLKEFNRKKMLSLGLVDPKTDEEKELIEQQKQAANQPDPQQALIEAAAQQQQAEARNLDAASAEKVARKGLIEAQTVETIAGIEQDQQKLDNDSVKAFVELRTKIREQNTKTLANLPIDQNTRVQ
ncbi:MAG: hypothetical protein COA96_10390 [SAR86 cluster bacterium]|uniref:Portal protein n=1 Tax=SAR86 cluster bacterium TaxID=2030880 RepID=A0A2A5AY38_9GAMM|nr:MAG: hypothetical protein COA96_10390 [SAR86 cluster bacterium]